MFFKLPFIGNLKQKNNLNTCSEQRLIGTHNKNIKASIKQHSYQFNKNYVAQKQKPISLTSRVREVVPKAQVLETQVVNVVATTQESCLILSADVGGTNCRLCMWQVYKDNHSLPQAIFRKVVPTSSYDTLQEAINFVLQLNSEKVKQFSSVKLAAICIAVAGPIKKFQDVKGNVWSKAKLTNAAWTVNSQHIQEVFNVQTVIMNDFEAIGYGLLSVNAQSIYNITRNQPSPFGPISLLGAGTGLGEAQLFWDDHIHNYRVWPSEGSHADFAPRGTLQQELLAYLSQQLGIVEVEHLGQGQSISRIYEFMTNKYLKKAEFLRSQDITKLSKEGDSLAQRSVDLFLHIIGQEAGAMALRQLSTGGVYVAGGLLSQEGIWERISNGTLYQGFLNPSSRFRKQLEQIPVYVIRDSGPKSEKLMLEQFGGNLSQAQQEDYTIGELGARQYATILMLKWHQPQWKAVEDVNDHLKERE